MIRFVVYKNVRHTKYDICSKKNDIFFKAIISKQSCSSQYKWVALKGPTTQLQVSKQL